MRSLAPTGLSIASLAKVSPGKRAAAVAVDPESGALYVACESKDDEDGVQVDLVRIGTADEGNAIEVLAPFSSPVVAPFPLPEDRSEVVDLHYFPDDRSLVVLLAGGDIATFTTEDQGRSPQQVEVVGSIDSGIKAAAWSPDDEQLILVTGEDVLVCMTRTFDTIHEEPLRKEDFGEDKFINVGWGSKTTQFHGSLGKAAAREASAPASSSTASSSKPASVSHPTDDGLPRISFRGDAAFFAVSSLDAYPESLGYARRQVRIYSRDSSAGYAPRLSATSESLPGLEGPLAWRPSGNLISTLVRYGYEGGGAGQQGRWEVAMLERNGLRHGGFPLREGLQTWKDGRVRGMEWNSDSEVLAIWLERPDEDVVQLWTMKNYHYYLKQEIRSHDASSRRFRGIRWHPEQAMTLYLLGSETVRASTFVWETYAARLDMPRDTATIAVVDGDKLLVTPFRSQNVPPPMSAYSISLPTVPVHVSVSNEEDALAVVFGDGRVQVWNLNTRIPEKGSSARGASPARPELRLERNIKLVNAVVKTVALGRDDEVAVLCYSPNEGSQLFISPAVGEQEERAAEGDIERLLWSTEKGWLVLDTDGMLRTVEANEPLDVMLCSRPLLVSTHDDLAFALSPGGKLLVAPLELDASPTSLATSVTSFTTTPEYLIYTTSAQQSFYAPLPVVSSLAKGEDVPSYAREWEQRRVERGALIVVACPSQMSLVLQMPRGNLETVYPKPLVLTVVRRDILSGSYRSAFLTCRKHRLDLNVLYDLEPKRFLDNLPEFVEQVPEVDYLNLFVSSLTDHDSAKNLYKDLARAESVSASITPVDDKVNNVCDRLRAILEAKDLVKYVDTILTTHVCKQPADYEAGLRLLLQLQEGHADIVEDAIKYIIFLSDVDKLYDVALGMYNFQLVLMIAQYSQKDPKEYLPFLRELRAMGKWEQRFQIDDHLGRRESALRNLKAAGPETFAEAASYLSRYELFDEAFKLYAAEPDHLNVVRELYGDYLYDRRDFYDAALSYRLADKSTKALKAYDRAHAWREAFALAKQENASETSIAEMCTRFTEHLASRGRHPEAAQIFVEYAKDVDSAIDVLCRGSEFADAYRLCAVHDREDCVEGIIHPALEDACEGLVEVVEEMEGQLDKEMKRLAELRIIRLEDPDTFYIVDSEPALEGVDVATNATTAMTNFTRYTVAPTTVFSQSTRITGQTAKSRHKASKRRAAGRKGTVDEYEYLLASIGRLVARLDEKSADALSLMRHLLVASEDHRALAKDLQSQIMAFRAKLASSITEGWRGRDAILDEAAESGGMGLGGEVTLAIRELQPPAVVPWKGLGVLLGQ